MGKPLSRPDCLRQNPPCVGKVEEEDFNIEDCYVPQRSIYDTVRLNEQIDSGSKGSLTSRHFTDRTLPYSNRTLDSSTMCSSGALACNNECRNRDNEPCKLDEKMIYDALKLNREINRPGGLPRNRNKSEKREHRRSWRIFVPVNLADYVSRSESSYADSPTSDTLNSCIKETHSLTSEDDSGVCSPQAEGDDKPELAAMEQGGQQVGLTSVDSSDLVGNLLSGISNSGQHTPFLLYAKVQSDLDFSLITCSITDSKSPEFHSALSSDVDLDSECSNPCEGYVNLEDSFNLFEEEENRLTIDPVKQKGKVGDTSDGLNVYNEMKSANGGYYNMVYTVPGHKQPKMARAKSWGILGSPTRHKASMVHPKTIPMRERCKIWTKVTKRRKQTVYSPSSKVRYDLFMHMSMFCF